MHIKTGDKFTRFRCYGIETSFFQQRRDRRPQDKQFFVFGRTEAIQDNANFLRSFWTFRKKFLHQQACQTGGRQDRLLLDPRLAVNAETKRHLAFRYGEERVRCARQSAAFEGNAKGHSVRVRVA